MKLFWSPSAADFEPPRCKIACSACEDRPFVGTIFDVPRQGPLVVFEVSRDGGSIVLSYRERGTGLGATLAFTRRGTLTLARILEGTRVTSSSEPARVEIVAKVRDHVQTARRKPAA